ncbi:hypothetical protein N7478_007366 [Penicillium angulare]|uniref:uncharacterized protein n=1 Tax=Penicillium angulare TaxID=116970 RepID=UPI002542398E|nr:uncharacterized protein N7478_007366 [Penicillium angulare]KAJ5281994.1 hypothetical protein N7478_007366 [Penicillium angulare]
MRLNTSIAVAASLCLVESIHAINIISSNDDGWAEVNIRAFYKSLNSAGHVTVVSAPAENQSGTGSSQKTPTVLKACEFDSCPAGSPAIGYNASEPRLNYVNSYPATSIKYGINSIGPKFFDGVAPDLAVTGPNVGNNIGLEVYFSGTAGAATYASYNAGIPAIAFSGATGSQTAWNASLDFPLYSEVYADLAVNVTDTLIASGTPYLPNDIWLNVNFGSVSDSECSDADDFKFVLSRIHTAIPLITPDDVTTCGSSRLPSELEVSLESGCYASISVGLASKKGDANATMQETVMKKLSGILTCLD